MHKTAIELLPSIQEEQHFQKYNNYRKAGLVVFTIQLLFLIGAFFFPTDNPEGFLPFVFFGHLFNVIYGISLIRFGRYYRKHKLTFSRIPLHAILLATFSAGAYALNTSLNIFGNFVPWVLVVIALLHLSLIAIAYIDLLPNVIFKPMHFIIGIAFSLVVFQTIFLLPMTHIGLLGLIGFGLGAYTFVPAFSILFFVQYIRKFQAKYLNYFLAGISFSLVVSLFYIFQWKTLSGKINEAHVSTYTHEANELPEWAVLSQIWQGGNLSKKIIEGHREYQIPKFNQGFDYLFDGGGKKHDPLAFIAYSLGEKINLSQEERKKILDSKFDARHQSYSKLWGDSDLTTTDIITHMQVYPDYRIGYLEKTITINNGNRWKNSQQEALYTFHVPPGSVATSLSLWVNGVEEKSRLTTKKKATQAYNTIVGRERRDPALLHWQEGNRITVTVFPCTPEEDRVFKIGFTIPLEEQGEQLILKNVFFEGPTIKNAEENTIIKFESRHDFDYDLPRGFVAQSSKEVKKTGDYTPSWELKISKTPITMEPFQFEDVNYSISPLTYIADKESTTAYYLDINDSWSKSEVEEIFKALEGQPMYVWNNEFFKVKNQKDPSIANVLRNQQFSLFPIHRIPADQHPVVVSKSIFNSPNLGDLKNSKFESSLKKYITQTNRKINVWYLSDEISPYWATLKEMQLVNLKIGTPSGLASIASEGNFPIPNLKANDIALGNAGIKISITENLEQVKNMAPDHLMRLYNYNVLLRDMDGAFFNAAEYEEGPLIELAELAHVASPVSSMVVLETIKDYERFDIDEKKRGLENAKVNSSGAVPEPHEWLLIFLGLTAILYLKLKQKLSVQWIR